MTTTRTLVFARDPEPGRTKTRLIPALGAEGACRCYVAMLETMLERLARHAKGPVELWADRAPQRPTLARCAERYGMTLRTQCEGDLGERMVHALEATLATGDLAMVVGSDVLGLGPEHLVQAAAALAGGADAVFAPARDGGYGLVGLSRPAPELFDGIDWGTSVVMTQTRERYGTRSVVELDTVWDVDEPDDLACLRGLGTELEHACGRHASVDGAHVDPDS